MMRLKLRASMGLVNLRSSEGGNKAGLIGQLWEQGAAGKRDFLQSESDMTELVNAFIQTFPAGAGKEAIRKSLGGASEEAHALLLMLCQYLTRQISNDDDSYVVRLFSREEGTALASRNCCIISRIIIPALQTSDDLQPVCEAGVPSRVVKLLVRMQTMAVLIESGRSSNRSGVSPDSHVKQDEINSALNVVVRILRHVCGSVSNGEEEGSEGPNVNMCAVEDLVRGDAIRSLIDLVGQAAKSYSAGLSRWIEVHAVDVLLTVLRHGMCGVLANHVRQFDLLQPVVEALVIALDAHETPNLLGVIGLFKVLLQSSVAACGVKQFAFVDYVRSLQLTGGSDTPTYLALSSESQAVPLVLSLLKHYMIRLAGLVYVQGNFEDEEGKDSSKLEAYPQWHEAKGHAHALPQSSHAKGAETWGQMTQDQVKASLEEVREFKARRLVHHLSGPRGVAMTREEALRQLQECAWDVQEAEEQARNGAIYGRHADNPSSQAVPTGGLGLRLVVPDDTPAGEAARYFIVAKVMEHGAAFRSGAVHAGDRLLKVDGVTTSKMNLDELATRLKGPVGSHVTLVLQAAHTTDDRDSAPGAVRMATLLRSALVTKRAAGGAQTELSYADMNACVDKVVEKMQTAVTAQSARSILEKCHWNVERAVMDCRVLPHSQAMAHLLDIARELVFVGEEDEGVNMIQANDTSLQHKTQSSYSTPATHTHTNAGTPTNGHERSWVDTQDDEEEQMGKVAGRRVRDVLAFDLLCELWHACPDDQLRLELLDMALVIFAEHPLNFFALQESPLMTSAMDSLEFLGHAGRQRVLRLLEYVLTVEGCLPLQHLCRLTRNLDVLWRKSTAVLVLSNVIKWLQFDTRLVAVCRQTGLLHVLLRHCQIFSQNQSQQPPAAYSRLARQPSINHTSMQEEREHVILVEDEEEEGVLVEALEDAGLIGGDGNVSYAALMAHIQELVDFESLSPDLANLGEEEAAVLLDRVWGAINPDYVFQNVPIEWHAKSQQVVSFLHLIYSGEDGQMASVPPAVIGKLALAITRAYVQALSREKGGKRDAKSKSRRAVAQPKAAARKAAARKAVRQLPASKPIDSEAPKRTTQCLICDHTFPVVIDTILALITGNEENVEVGREEGLSGSMMLLVPIFEWRDGAFRILQRLILNDGFLVNDDIGRLQAVVSACHVTDLEVRRDVIQMMLQLAYSHPRVRSQLRFGWMVQAVGMIEDLGKATESSWGEKLELCDMLCTFLCLAMASSHTNRMGLWSDLGSKTLGSAFEASTLMTVGKGLSVLGMLLSISINRDVVPEAMLHGGDSKGGLDKEASKGRTWQGIAQTFDSPTELAVFINRWADHSDGQAAAGGHSVRIRNPDAVVLAVLVLKQVHRDARLHAARAILRLARMSHHNCRSLTEAGLVSVLLNHYSATIFGKEDEMLRPVLSELLVHFTRQRLSIKDMHTVFQRLFPAGCSGAQMVQGLDVLQQATGAPNILSSTCTAHPYFEARINCAQEDTGEKHKCEALLQVDGLEGMSWPPATAFSFAAWFRIDSMANKQQSSMPDLSASASTPSRSTASSTKPSALVFILRGGLQAVSLKAVITNGALCVESPGRFALVFNSYTFEFGKLYHLAVLYQRGALLGPDSVKLFVDGVLEEEQKVASNKNMTDLKKSAGMDKEALTLVVGGDTPGAGAGNTAWIAPAVLRIGDVCLVDEAMPARYIYGLFLVGSQRFPQIGSELGPLIASDMMTETVVSQFDKALLLTPSEVCTKSLSTGTLSVASVKFSCSASSVSNYRQVLPFSSALEPDASIAKLVSKVFGAEGAKSCDMRLHDSVLCIHPLAFGQALRTVGGVQMLFELVSRAQSTQSLNKTLNLLVAWVRHEACNLEKMALCEGYSLLSLLLESKAHLMDLASVDAAFELVGICSTKPGAGHLANHLALRDLVLCNNLWQRLDAKMRAHVYKMLCGAVSCKYDALTAARLAQVGAVNCWLDVLTQDASPLSKDGVEEVSSMLSFILRFHFSLSDLKRLVLAILSSLPAPLVSDAQTGRKPSAQGGGEGRGGEGRGIDVRGIEEVSRRVHIRNILLSMLLSQVKYFTQNKDEKACDHMHALLNGRLMLHILSRRVHSSSMCLVLQLLTYHLMAKAKYSKRFTESGCVEELKELMCRYSESPHAYLLLLHSLFSTPIVSAPDVIDGESIGLYMKALSTQDVTFAGAFVVIGAMLHKASTKCKHHSRPLTPWTSLCSVRTSLESGGNESRGTFESSLVRLAEIEAFVSELFNCIKMLFSCNKSFRAHCLNDALLSSNILTVVLPPPLHVTDTQRFDGSEVAHCVHPEDAHTEEPVTDASSEDEDSSEHEGSDHDGASSGIMVGGGHGGHGAAIHDAIEEECLDQEDLDDDEERASLGMLAGDQDSLQQLSSEQYEALQRELSPEAQTYLVPPPPAAAPGARASSLGPEEVGTRISQQEQQENKTKRRVTLGGMIGSTGAAMKAGVSGAASVAIMPVTGLAMGVGALGHGAMAGASALGSSVKGMQFHVSMGSGTPLKDFNTSNFVLVSMQEFAEGGCLGDASSAHQVCRGAGNESSFVQVDLDSSAQRADDGGEAYVSGNASANSLAGAAPHGPRASRHALQQLDWSLSSQTMELLCLVVLQSTKLQGRGHGVLRKTIDGSVPQGVPDAQVAVYQTRMLLSIVRFLMNETDRDLILANTKLAINICKLCEYLVDKMYCGWLVAGHQDVLRFCLHGIESVQNHSVYSNLYRGAAAASWKAALYILSLAAGPVLSKALEYISENFNLVLNATGMDQVACCQVFKCLTDVLLMEDSAVKRHSTDDPALLPNAAKVAGQMLSVNSPHTRSVLIGLLVYKPSMTAKLFRKGEKEKAIDLMKNGFDKLCGSESVSTLNPLRAWWKPGDHLDDFRIWALDGANKSGIRARLSEALEASSKDWRQRCARTLREDLCALAVRSTKEAPAAKREAAAQRNLLAAVSKREKAYEEDVMAYRHERAIASQRALMRQIKAHFAWAKSRHLLIGPAGVWSSQALLPHLEPREPERQDGSNNSKEGWTIEGFQDKVAWTIDSFQDSLHLRRRRVPMPKPLSLDAPQQRSNQWLAASGLMGEVSDEASLAVALAGVSINKDWNDATSDDDVQDDDLHATSPPTNTKHPQHPNRAHKTVNNESSSQQPLPPSTPSQEEKREEQGGDGHAQSATAADQASSTQAQDSAPEQESGGKKSIFGRLTKGVGAPHFSLPILTAARSRRHPLEVTAGADNAQHPPHNDADQTPNNDAAQTPDPACSKHVDETQDETPELHEQPADTAAAPAAAASAHQDGGADDAHDDEDDVYRLTSCPSSASEASTGVEQVANGVGLAQMGLDECALDQYGVSALVDDRHLVMRTDKVSRVEGLDCIAGTLAMCRTRTGDSSIKALYFIDDAALHDSLHQCCTNNDASKLPSTSAHNMTFRHIHEIAPGVLKWEEHETAWVMRRSWLQQPLGLELFHVRGACTLLVLPSAKARNEVLALLSPSGSLASDARWLMEASGLSGIAGGDWRVQTRKMLSDARKVLLKKWSSGLISNLEFLMELNLLAGRSTNDVSRYPVFPWVLADYSSETLDLNDPATFRDLSKPMGCQNAQRQLAFQERYNEWDQDDNQCPPFHYGTHYSTSAHVLHFLVRVEPYTTMHLSLQSGRFDQPDRLFHDMNETWTSSSGNENMTEVKELIPEMFYLPDMFENNARLDLGQRQDGQRVDKVRLPPWAHGDAGEFVRLHRAALESVYVSANLHKWIDLIFGYKQRGRFAVEAVNVFHYLTYEGAVDVASIKDKDEVQYQAVLSQMSHFGQCPKQMFQRPQPARVTTPGYSAISNPELLQCIEVDVGMMVGDVLTQDDKVLAIGFGSVLVHPTGQLCLIPDIKYPGSVSVVVTETKKTVGLMQRLHEGLVTTMAVGVACDASVLATGGQDGVVRLWDIAHEAWWMLPPRSLSKDADSLIGHKGAVTTLVLSVSQGVGLSGADDGSAIMWDIARSTSLHLLGGHKDAVTGVAIDDENGSILTCSASHIQAWSINGQRLASLHRQHCQAFKVDVQACAGRSGTIWSVETIFVTGHSDGHITFWKLMPVQRARREAIIGRDLPSAAPNTPDLCPQVLAPMWTFGASGEAVTVLHFSPDCRELVSGHERGKCKVWRISEKRPIMQEVHKLMQQDVFLVALPQALNAPHTFPSTSTTKCLTRQAALHVVRAAADPCVPYIEGDTRAASRVYAALSMHGYLQACVNALNEQDASGALTQDWHAWLHHFAGPWAQFWSEAEEFLALRIPHLSPTWLHEQVEVLRTSPSCT